MKILQLPSDSMMKYKALSFMIINKTRTSTFTTPIQQVLEVLTRVIRQGQLNRKERSKTLFADDMILTSEI